MFIIFIFQSYFRGALALDAAAAAAVFYWFFVGFFFLISFLNNLKVVYSLK